MKIFKIEKQNNKIRLYLFGIRVLSLTKKKLLNPFKKPFLRNDDVSVDTHLGHFRDFCEIFHKYGYTQTHAVNLYGYTNCAFLVDGIPATYKGYNLGTTENAKIIELSQGKFIGDNKALIAYLNQIPDDIALHGLYHTDYSKMSYEEQKKDIQEGLRLLKELFPNKEVKIFVAPFNRTNKFTYKVCKELNLRVSAQEGEHLEDMIANARYGLKNGETYRYHHHRFYPETTFFYYDLNLDTLNGFLGYKTNQKRKLPDKEFFAKIIKKHNAQEWFVYAYNDFTQRAHAFLPYLWIKENVSKDKSILATGCGAGDMLYMLYMLYYDKLSAYDYDEKAIAAAKEISKSIDAPINFFVEDGRHPNLTQNYDVIIGINWIYHCPEYSLENFLKLHRPYLNNKGLFIFDTIDTAFNNLANNKFSTQDWDKPIEQRRPSEYLYRYSKDDIEKLAQKYNLNILYHHYIDGAVPHAVYVLQSIGQ